MTPPSVICLQKRRRTPAKTRGRAETHTGRSRHPQTNSK